MLDRVVTEGCHLIPIMQMGMTMRHRPTSHTFLDTIHIPDIVKTVTVIMQPKLIQESLINCIS